MLSSLLALARAFSGGHGCQCERSRSGASIGSPSALNPMSASTLRLSELPTEILEHVLLHLPDRDIIKVEAVRTSLQSPRGRALTLPDALDQQTLPGPCSQFAHHPPSARTVFGRFSRQSPQPLRVGRTSETMRGVCIQVVRCGEDGKEHPRVAPEPIFRLEPLHDPQQKRSRLSFSRGLRTCFPAHPPAHGSKGGRGVECPPVPLQTL